MQLIRTWCDLKHRAHLVQHHQQGYAAGGAERSAEVPQSNRANWWLLCLLRGSLARPTGGDNRANRLALSCQNICQ
jgi:hypothetical protein